MSETNTGSLTIDPPLNWAQIREVTAQIKKAVKTEGWGSKYVKDSIADLRPDEMRYHMGFGLEVVERTEQTPEGELVVKTASTLSYHSSDSRSSNLSEGRIVEIVAKVATGAKVEGVLNNINEDGDRGTRSIWKDGKASAVSGVAYMKWADGTESKITDLY